MEEEQFACLWQVSVAGFVPLSPVCGPMADLVQLCINLEADSIPSSL